MILSYLYVVESVDYVFLVQHTGLTWGNLSAHINKLELEGYIAVKKEFVNKKPNSLVTITKLGRDEFDKYRYHMKGIYNDFPDE
jgi:DNA-binding MarR family transcriptional regulator